MTNTTTNGAHVEVTLREQLRRANPTVDGPTYRLLTGQITEDEYKAALNTERVKFGLPPVNSDPLYVAPDPCHTTGRIFPKPIVRELLRSLGVTTCPDCHRYTGMAPRVERPLRRKGTGWRERP